MLVGRIHIFSFPNRPERLWGPSKLLLDGYRGSFRRPEVNQSFRSTSKVKNERSYEPTCTTHVYSVQPSYVLSATRRTIGVFYTYKNNELPPVVSHGLSQGNV